jgi:hypothetical protein
MQTAQVIRTVMVANTSTTQSSVNKIWLSPPFSGHGEIDIAIEMILLEMD